MSNKRKLPRPKRPRPRPTFGPTPADIRGVWGQFVSGLSPAELMQLAPLARHVDQQLAKLDQAQPDQES